MISVTLRVDRAGLPSMLAKALDVRVAVMSAAIEFLGAEIVGAVRVTGRGALPAMLNGGPVAVRGVDREAVNGILRPHDLPVVVLQDLSLLACVLADAEAVGLTTATVRFAHPMAETMATFTVNLADGVDVEALRARLTAEHEQLYSSRFPTAAVLAAETRPTSEFAREWLQYRLGASLRGLARAEGYEGESAERRATTIRRHVAVVERWLGVEVSSIEASLTPTTFEIAELVGPRGELQNAS